MKWLSNILGTESIYIKIAIFCKNIYVKNTAQTDRKTIR